MDARRLVMLYVFELQQFKINSPDDEVYLTLKMLLRSYYDLQTERTMHLLKLNSLVDQVYLGFDKDCLKLSSSAGLAFLVKYPLPQDVLRARKDTVLKCLTKASRKGMTWAQIKLETILVKARTMAKLGANEAVFADLIRSEIVLYQALDQQMAARLERVKDYLQKNTMSDKPKLALQVALLQTIPGVGLISALTIVAECGDISRFKHARARTAFAGLDPSVKESGQFKGTRNKISKRGNRQLRRALYMVAMRSVSTNRKGDYVDVLFSRAIRTLLANNQYRLFGALTD
jgi:transposase